MTIFNQHHSHNALGEDLEAEGVAAVPPPTAPELEEAMDFDLKVLAIWDFLLSYNSNEYKQHVRKQSMEGGVSVGYRQYSSFANSYLPITYFVRKS